jgi:hypothetical protein
MILSMTLYAEVKQAAILFFIWKIPGSNPALETSYLD